MPNKDELYFFIFYFFIRYSHLINSTLIQSPEAAYNIFTSLSSMSHLHSLLVPSYILPGSKMSTELMKIKIYSLHLILHLWQWINKEQYVHNLFGNDVWSRYSQPDFHKLGRLQKGLIPFFLTCAKTHLLFVPFQNHSFVLKTNNQYYSQPNPNYSMQPIRKKPNKNQMTIISFLKWENHNLFCCTGRIFTATHPKSMISTIIKEPHTHYTEN